MKITLTKVSVGRKSKILVRYEILEAARLGWPKLPYVISYTLFKTTSKNFLTQYIFCRSHHRTRIFDLRTISYYSIKNCIRNIRILWIVILNCSRLKSIILQGKITGRPIPGNTGTVGKLKVSVIRILRFLICHFFHFKFFLRLQLTYEKIFN